MAEGNPEVAGERVAQVDQVLFSQGFVQAKIGLNLGPDLGGQFGVLGVDGRIVAGLGLHQEKGQCDNKE